MLQRMGQFPSVQLLLANGANRHTADQTWMECPPCLLVSWFCRHYRSCPANETGTSPLQNRAVGDTIALAARGGHVHACEMLIGGGALLDSQIRGLAHQPLHEAAMRGYFEVCALLVRHGADPYAQEYGTTKRTALKLARDFCHNNCVTVMLNGGRIEGLVEGKTASEKDALDSDGIDAKTKARHKESGNIITW